MHKLFTIFIFLIGFNSIAQENKLLVVDASNNNAIAYASVIAENSKGEKVYGTTNGNGEIECKLSGAVKLQVSFMGYKTFNETVNLSNVKKIKLEQDIFFLDQVIVTGQNKPMLRDSSIYDVRVFDSKLIQQRGAVNLGDALRAEPSITIKQSSATGSNINILGLGGENVKIMIDGVPIIGRLDGNLDLNQISLENVDHIEVVEGPMSVIYGSNALAGTVNIITKNNKWNKFLTNINTYYESPATINADALVSTTFGRHVLTGTFARNYFDGISKDNSRESKWRSSEQYNSELRYAYNGKSYQFRMSGKYFDEFMKNKGSVDKTSLSAIDNNYYTKRYSFNSFLEIDHGSKMQTNYQGSVSFYDRITEGIRKDMTDLSEIKISGETDTTSFISYMARATFNHKINSKISYQTGIDINSEKVTAQRIQGNSQDISDYAIFITGKHTVFKNLVIQPGFRYAYNSKFNAPLQYSVNFLSDFSKGWQFRASYATGFRAPSLKELYLDFPHGGINVLGNPNLKAESSNALNGSLSFSRRENGDYYYRFELKGYYNDIYDKIDFVRVADINGVETWSNVNITNVESLGFVSAIQFEYKNIWQVDFNFTRGGLTSLEWLNSVSNHSKFIYSNNFLTAFTYKIPSIDLSSRIEYSYNGETGLRSLNDWKDNQGNVINTTEPMLASYHDLNFSVSKSFWEGRANLTAGVKNILNNTDLEIFNEDPLNQMKQILSWGRSYFVKLKIELRNN